MNMNQKNVPIKNAFVCVCVCVSHNSYNKRILFPMDKISQLIFIMHTDSVLCDVRI